MPTPIRVRGKRKAANESISGSVRPRRARKFDPSPKKHQPHLHELPVELIQEIFCYGTNLRLPLVCSSLYHALTSHPVKVRLVLRLFSVEDFIDTDAENIIRHGVWPRYDSPITVWQKRCVEKDASIAQSQRAVLRQSWFTYDFLRECQRKYLTRALHGELRKFLSRETKSVLDAQLRKVDECLESNLVWGAYSPRFAHTQTDRGILWERVRSPSPTECCYHFQREDGESMTIFLPDAFGLNSQVAFLRQGPSLGAGCASRYTFPALQARCKIPSRLQHGPWTQQKGHLLTQLVFSIAAAGGRPELLPPANDSSTIGDGLLDAIHEQCLPWLRLFIAQTDHKRHLNVATIKHMGGAVCPQSPLPICLPSGDPEVNLTNAQLRLDATGPWRAINEPDLGILPRCDIAGVSTKHFEAMLHEAPVGTFSCGLFVWLFKNLELTQEQLRDIQTMVIRARVDAEESAPVEAEDPTRMDMIGIIARQIDNYMNSNIWYVDDSD